MGSLLLALSGALSLTLHRIRIRRPEMLRQYTGPETPALNEDERRRVPVLVAVLVLTLLYGFGGTTLTGSLPQTQQTPAWTGVLTASVLEQRAREYFTAWNSHDAGKLRQLFQEGGDDSARG